MTALHRLFWLLLMAFSVVTHAQTGEALLKEALKVEEELRNKTSIFDRQPDFNPAIELYSKALSANDLSSTRKALALLNRAALLVAQDNCFAAVKDLDQTLQLKPKQVKAHALRASCKQQSKLFKEALDDLNAAVALAPRDPVLLHGRATVHVSLSDYDKAIRDYTSSINSLNPNESSDLFVERGDAFVAQGKHQRAIEDYQRAVQITKKNAAKLAPTGSGSGMKQLQPIFKKLGDAYHALAKAN